jgi:hypothetical protein
MVVAPKNRLCLQGFRGPLGASSSAVTPQNITATPTAVGQSMFSPSGPYVQHCIYVHAPQTGLNEDPLNHNFELPTRTDRWGSRTKTMGQHNRDRKDHSWCDWTLHPTVLHV